MKNFLKKLLYWLLGIVIFIVVLFIVYLVISKSVVRKMTPVDTKQITEDVYAARDNYVNMYLVRDGNDFIAIDAGIKKGRIKDELKKLDIDPDRVKAVLLTHSDADHAGGITLFDKALVYLPKDEEQVINGETGRFLWMGNKLATDDYKLIDDNDFRIGGIRIKVIPTHGHTAGSACYLVNGRYLFTGDAVRLYNGKMERFPALINKSARKARKSMKNLKGLDGVQYIFTGHYGYTADYRNAVSPRD